MKTPATRNAVRGIARGIGSGEKNHKLGLCATVVDYRRGLVSAYVTGSVTRRLGTIAPTQESKIIDPEIKWFAAAADHEVDAAHSRAVEVEIVEMRDELRPRFRKRYDFLRHGSDIGELAIGSVTPRRDHLTDRGVARNRPVGRGDEPVAEPTSPEKRGRASWDSGILPVCMVNIIDNLDLVVRRHFCRAFAA